MVLQSRIVRIASMALTGKTAVAVAVSIRRLRTGKWMS